ncbi:MAG: hypothetical protein JNK63_04935 [Chthonomonas sp.]|nr:hypothetical protein [Chthonomonas sp.]
MDEQKTQKSPVTRTLAWTAFGILVGVGIAAYAIKRRNGEETSLGETLEDLFKVCENDCAKLESRLSQMAS